MKTFTSIKNAHQYYAGIVKFYKKLVCTRKPNFTKIANKNHCDYIEIHPL